MRTCKTCSHRTGVYNTSSGGIRLQCDKQDEFVSEDTICSSWHPAPRNGCRPVTYIGKRLKAPSLYEDYEVGIAYFHTFSVVTDEDGSTPVALIECEDGKMKSWDADRIKFLDVEV